MKYDIKRARKSKITVDNPNNPVPLFKVSTWAYYSD